MKTITFLAVIVLSFWVMSFAQNDPDPGLQDSIIVGQISFDPTWSTVNVPVYAVTDDSVASFNIPLGWFPHGLGIQAGQNGDYYYPLTTWDFIFDTALVNQDFFRTVGVFDVFGDTGINVPLLTNGVRMHIMTLHFIIPPDWDWQNVQIDTVHDEVNGSMFFGMPDGITGFVPAFQFGALLPIMGIDNDGKLPDTYALKQNYPNPFNPSTQIEFALASAGHLSLQIYDILGRNVKTLIDKDIEAGQYSIIWDGTNNSGQDVPSGAYFYKLTANSFVQTKKMLLIR